MAGRLADCLIPKRLDVTRQANRRTTVGRDAGLEASRLWLSSTLTLWGCVRVPGSEAVG